MPINFSENLYAPNYNTFARTVKIIPLASQPGGLPYTARGIYDTVSVDIVAMDGSIISDQRTILDIRDAEFSKMPEQRDHVIIPSDSGLPDLGEFEIADKTNNGGGETTLTLRKVTQARP